jgi:hypothetical protein
MKKSNHIKPILTGAVVLICGVLVVNLFLAAIFPDWKGFVSNDTLAGLNAAFSKTQSLSKPESTPPSLAQGGVNIQKSRDVVKNIINEAEENAPIGSAAPKPESPAPVADNSAVEDTSENMVPKVELTEAQKIEIALKKFQDALTERDVIKEGQEDLVQPYIEKRSNRDNPFDEVKEADPIYAIPAGGLPPDPFYPPPGDRVDPGETLKEYVKTINLQGVVMIEDKYFAFIDSGGQTHKQTKGDSYKDKIKVNVDDISLDAVLLSDEFGNQAFIDFGFRKGFEVQPVDEVIYITNIGTKREKEE